VRARLPANRKRRAAAGSQHCRRGRSAARVPDKNAFLDYAACKAADIASYTLHFGNLGSSGFIGCPLAVEGKVVSRQLSVVSGGGSDRGSEGARDQERAHGRPFCASGAVKSSHSMQARVEFPVASGIGECRARFPGVARLGEMSKMTPDYPGRRWSVGYGFGSEWVCGRIFSGRSP
jgi:hypothetical protein